MTARSIELVILFGSTFIATAAAIIGALVVLPPNWSDQIPWWERACRTYPARMAPVITIFVISQVIFPTVALAFGIFQMPPPPVWFGVVCAAPLIGPVAVAFVMAWLAASTRRPIGYWVIGCFSAALFRFPNSLIYASLAIALYFLPHDLLNAAVVLMGGGLLMAFVAWGGNIWIASVIGLARPALPRGARAADWAAERVGIRPSKVLELYWPRVRVDAFMFSQYLVFTDSAARLLSDDELLALSIREITFFQQKGLAGTLRIADSLVVYLMLVCVVVGMVIGGQAPLIGTCIGVGAVLLIRPFMRRAQLKADALAAAAAIDPTSALRAMERQSELNLQPIVTMFKRSNEAHLYDRMVAAQVVPAYPRPNPPSKWRIVLSVTVATASAVLLSITFLVALYIATQG